MARIKALQAMLSGVSEGERERERSGACQQVVWRVRTAVGCLHAAEEGADG